MSRQVSMMVMLALSVACNPSGGGGGGSDACTPGQQVACACGGGTQGYQQCNAQGTGLGACQGCPEASSSSSGGGASTSASWPFGSTSFSGRTCTTAASVAATPGNNAVVLTGCTLGNGSADNARLSRSVAVQATGDTQGLTLDGAWMVRFRDDSPHATVLLPVTNTGAPRCGFSLRQFILRDGQGSVLFTSSWTGLEGEVGIYSDGTAATAQCLGTGHQGWFIQVANDLRNAQGNPAFDGVQGLEISVGGGSTYDPWDAEVPADLFRATGYSLREWMPGSYNLDVSFRNASTRMLATDNVVSMVALDAQGHPVAYQWFAVLGTGTQVPAGGTLERTCPFFNFTGQADSLLVMARVRLP